MTAMTKHFQQRMNDRGISQYMVDLALTFGQRIFAHKSLYVFVGARQLLKMRACGHSVEDKMNGLTLVLNSSDRSLITCFKNRGWLKKVRQKA
jgi:hypothetical protein